VRQSGEIIGETSGAFGVWIEAVVGDGKGCGLDREFASGVKVRQFAHDAFAVSCDVFKVLLLLEDRDSR